MIFIFNWIFFNYLAEKYLSPRALDKEEVSRKSKLIIEDTAATTNKRNTTDTLSQTVCIFYFH